MLLFFSATRYNYDEAGDIISGGAIDILIEIARQWTTDCDHIALWRMSSNFCTQNMADIWKTGCYWAEQCVRLLYVTATSQLLHYVNKFLLAYVILFKHVNFRYYLVCLRESIFNFCNALMSGSIEVRNPISQRHCLSMEVVFGGPFQVWHCLW